MPDKNSSPSEFVALAQREMQIAIEEMIGWQIDKAQTRAARVLVWLLLAQAATMIEDLHDGPRHGRTQ